MMWIDVIGSSCFWNSLAFEVVYLMPSYLSTQGSFYRGSELTVDCILSKNSIKASMISFSLWTMRILLTNQPLIMKTKLLNNHRKNHLTLHQRNGNGQTPNMVYLEG